jgi:hypothetical protein
MKAMIQTGGQNVELLNVNTNTIGLCRVGKVYLFIQPSFSEETVLCCFRLSSTALFIELIEASRHEEIQRERGYISKLFVTSALDGDYLSASRPGRLPEGERPPVHI